MAKLKNTTFCNKTTGANDLDDSKSNMDYDIVDKVPVLLAGQTDLLDLTLPATHRSFEQLLFYSNYSSHLWTFGIPLLSHVHYCYSRYFTCHLYIVELELVEELEYRCFLINNKC